jgi:hypothetical protein
MCRDDGCEITVIENDNGEWSFDDVVLGIERRQNEDAV